MRLTGRWIQPYLLRLLQEFLVSGSGNPNGLGIHTYTHTNILSFAVQLACLHDWTVSCMVVIYIFNIIYVVKHSISHHALLRLPCW